jgi:monoamine oxidase
MDGYSAYEIFGNLGSYFGGIPYRLNFFGLIELQLSLWDIDKKAKSLDVNEPWKHPKAKEWDSFTVETYLSKLWTNTCYSMIELLVHTIFGCEPNELSFLFFLHYFNCSGGVDVLMDVLGGAQDSKMEGGTCSLYNQMYDDIKENVHLNSQVIKIDQTLDTIKICTEDTTYYCNYIIMATSPVISSRIKYLPKLPGYRDQLSQKMVFIN